MHEIATYSDLRRYLHNVNLPNICWYGPRATDVFELEDILSVDGVICCYGGNKQGSKVPCFTNERNGIRLKCSVDELAGELISTDALLPFINLNNINTILPYDSNQELEDFCKNNNIRYLSSPDNLKEKMRDKTRVGMYCEQLNIPTIPGFTGAIEEFEYSAMVERLGLPLFLHFAEGAGGSGNYIVHSIEEFESIKERKRGTRLNIKKFLKGRSCSIDVCVTSSGIICGTLEEMLIGAEPLNTNPTEYVGSSWFENNYSSELREKICEIGVSLGNILRKQGFIGFFHPDFLVDCHGEIFMTEINMRFGGSIGIYTKAQKIQGQIPLLLAHVLEFNKADVQFNTFEINRQNLAPIDYALINLKNIYGKDIALSPVNKSGIYLLQKDKLEFVGPSVFSDLNDKEHFLISGLPEGVGKTTIENGAPICQIVTRFPISDTESKLNKEGGLLVSRVLTMLGLE